MGRRQEHPQLGLLADGNHPETPSVSLDPQHPLAATAAGVEKTTKLKEPISLWFLRSEAAVLVLTKAYMFWVCLQHFTGRNLLRLSRQDDLCPAQLGAGF